MCTYHVLFIKEFSVFFLGFWPLEGECVLNDLDLDDEWREIPNFPGYWISCYGEVYSDKTDKIRQPVFDGNYYSISLYARGVSETFKIHRLVADAFVPGYSADRCVVDHIDEDKTNNVSDNLEWVTHAENLRRAQHNRLLRQNGHSDENCK